MTDQNERREYIERARAIRRISHLIESGDLPHDVADDLQWLLKLEEENGKLKKIVADLLLDRAMRQAE